MPSLKKQLLFNSGSRKHPLQYMCILKMQMTGCICFIHEVYAATSCDWNLLRILHGHNITMSWIAKPCMYLWHDNSWIFRNNTERRAIALHPTNFLNPSLMTSFESSVWATLAWDPDSWTVSGYNLSFPTPQPVNLFAETWRSQCACKHYPRQWKLM